MSETCALYDDIVEIEDFPIDNPPKKKPKWQIEREAYLERRRKQREANKKKKASAAPTRRPAPKRAPPTRKKSPRTPRRSAPFSSGSNRIQRAEAKSSRFADQIEKYRRKKRVPESQVEPAMEDALRGAKKLYGSGQTLRASLEEIPVVWDGRMGAVGRCRFAGVGSIVVPYAIQLSSKVPISKKVAHDTLVHEFAHAIRGLVSKDYASEESHGNEWKKLMVASGQKPDVRCEDPEYNAARQMARLGAKTPAQKALAERYLKAGGASGVSKSKLRIGDTVYFMGKSGSGVTMIKGKVVKRNPVKAVVRQTSAKPAKTEGASWRVPYQSLSRKPF
jgi:hypothetical protein